MAVFCLLFLSVFGCSMGAEARTPFPELLSVEALSETEVAFEFSMPVRVVRLSFDPELGIASVEDGRRVSVRLKQGLEPGMHVVADIRVENAYGNIFSERIPFEKQGHFPEAEEPTDQPGNEESSAYPEDEYPPPPPESDEYPDYPGSDEPDDMPGNEKPPAYPEDNAPPSSPGNDKPDGTPESGGPTTSPEDNEPPASPGDDGPAGQPGNEPPPVFPEDNDPPASPGNDGPDGQPGSENPPAFPEDNDPPASPGNDEPAGQPGNETPPVFPEDNDPPASPGNDGPAGQPGSENPPAFPEDNDPPASPGYDEPDGQPGNEPPPAFPEDNEPPASPGNDEPTNPPEEAPPSDNPGNPGEGGAAWLVLNEMRTEALTAQSSPAHTRRVEFVELRALSAGNLGGLRMFIYRSGSSNPVVFEFPDTEVSAGEYIVLHLRTLVENQFVDAYPAAHNFWVPGTASIVNTNSAVYVQDRNGAVLTAVMISSGTVPAWWTRVAGFLFEQGAWKSLDGGVATLADTVDTADRGRGVTWSISRDETVPNTGTAADWYISARATPGRPNYEGRLP